MGVLNADVLLVFLVALAFSTLQPLMHIIGIVFFVLRFIVAKSQARHPTCASHLRHPTCAIPVMHAS